MNEVNDDDKQSNDDKGSGQAPSVWQNANARMKYE